MRIEGDQPTEMEEGCLRETPFFLAFQVHPDASTWMNAVRTTGTLPARRTVSSWVSSGVCSSRRSHVLFPLPPQPGN